MAWAKAASPPHCQTLLGCLGWTVHWLRPSPEGDKSLCSPRVALSHPCWTHCTHQGTDRMQAQARETVYWPSIDADIADYVCWCTICTKHKASLPAQPLLPRDVPSGLWQEITADYLTHKGREYLLICDLFSNYSFTYKVSTKSAQSLCMHLLELISQFGEPSLLFMDNGHPFTSEGLTVFLQCHHIDHATSSPHFPGIMGS